VRLKVDFHPSSTLHVNEDAVIHLLRCLLDEQVSHNSFLSRCGITLIEINGLTISLDPVETLKVNEEAVGRLLIRILTDEVKKNQFLTSAGILLHLEEVSWRYPQVNS
jgi:hypothetical protein